MFIGRKPNGDIYGAWTVHQPDDADHPGQKEVPDDDPDLLAFLAPKPPKDETDLNSNQKDIRAAVLAAAILAGKTPGEAEAAFKQARGSLPNDKEISK